MNRLLIPLLLLSLCACGTESSPIPETGHIQIVIGTMETRSPIATAAEESIRDAQFLVFDRLGNLCAWQRTTYPEGTDDYMADLRVPAGTLDIWVVTNLSASLQETPDVSSLLSRTLLLTDNALVAGGTEGLVMTGCATSIHVEAAETASCRIDVRRLVARVHIGSVRNALPSGRAIGEPALQLSNVVADRTLEGGSTPSRWCNKLLDKGGDLPAQAPVTGGSIGSGAVWNCDARLYAFPNPVTQDRIGGTSFTPRKTRLVFSCLLGDIRFYYPVTLEDLEENKSYRVDLIIGRPGSSDPDIPVETETCRFSIVPEPWEDAIAYEENL